MEICVKHLFNFFSVAQNFEEEIQEVEEKFFKKNQLVEKKVGLKQKISERVKGVEPSSSGWKPEALPLSYTRLLPFFDQASNPAFKFSPQFSTFSYCHS